MNWFCLSGYSWGLVAIHAHEWQLMVIHRFIVLTGLGVREVSKARNAECFLESLFRYTWTHSTQTHRKVSNDDEFLKDYLFCKKHPITFKIPTSQGNWDVAYVCLKSQYGNGNVGTVAEQQMLLKIHKVHTPWPMSHL